MIISEVIFLLSLLGVSFSYFLYPLILLIIKYIQKDTTYTEELTSNECPPVSFIITAYNEEKNIVAKIQDTLRADYARDKLEILVASDGSTDNTNHLVKQYSEQGVKLIEVTARKGKENAQLSAIKQAQGDILVFSDVATRIDPDALHIIARAFTRPEVGAISSEDHFLTEDGKIAGEGAYVKYEMWLRKLESSVYSLVGLSGSFFAARKTICQAWDINIPSDFNTALNSVRKGYVAITEPKLRGYYSNIKDEDKEYQRKLRTVIRGMAAVAHNPEVLNPFKLGFFSFEVISHKIMRWLVPWFQLSLFASSLAVWQSHSLYALVLFGQIAFYAIALIGWLIKPSRSLSLVKIPFFFMQVNLAIAHASVKFLAGERITKWEPSRR